jgi:hypothetical protein
MFMSLTFTLFVLVSLAFVRGQVPSSYHPTIRFGVVADTSGAFGNALLGYQFYANQVNIKGNYKYR